MAQPPRFQKKKKAAAPGFVEQVKGAMQQIQRELEAAQKASQEAAGHGRAAVKAAQEGVERSAGALKSEAERLRKEALKQKLKAQGRVRAKAPGDAAAEAQAALVEATRRVSRASELREAFAPSVEVPASEEEALEGVSAESSASQAPQAPVVVDHVVAAEAVAREARDWHAGLRRMLASRDALQQAFVLHEILGPPRGSFR